MNRSEESRELDRWNRRVRRSIRADRIVSWMLKWFVLTLLLVVGFSYYDMYRFTRAGIDGVAYRDFAALRQINPDVAAWLTLDGTHVDHPVVKGTDNFEYLDRDFYGKTYAGGTLFLDEQCPKDFAQEYQLIHGHHMAGGAMFGDLKKYLDKNFFRKNKRGQLLTPKGRYDLEIIGAGIFDAYDSKIYSINGKKNRPMESFRLLRRYGRPEDRGVLPNDGTGRISHGRKKRMTEEIAEKKRIVKSIRKGILIRAGTFALTLWIVFTFVFGIRIADRNDMAPAIREGDLVVYYRCGDFTNRDSVVYEANGNVYLGRIAGCQGAVIGKTEDHRLTIDGRIQPVQPGLGIYSETPAGDLKAGVTVEPGRFFILGDCRKESTDSRCFGTVGKDQIRGKVFLLWRRRNI